MFLEMIKTVNFTSVKVRQLQDCLNKAVKIFQEPTERRKRTPNLGGFCRLRPSHIPQPHKKEYQTCYSNSLVQAKSVLDVSKPRGQVFVFEGGFFFCFLFSIVLTRSFFVCFLLVKPLTITQNVSNTNTRKIHSRILEETTR